MALRESTERIVAMGRTPDDAHDVDDDVLTSWASALDAFEGPLTDEEAVALLSCFPTDGGTVFGLAWARWRQQQLDRWNRWARDDSQGRLWNPARPA